MPYMNIIFLQDKIDFNITEFKLNEDSIKLNGPISQRTKKRILRILRERFGEDWPCESLSKLEFLEWWHMKLDLEEKDVMELEDMEVSRF